MQEIRKHQSRTVLGLQLQKSKMKLFSLLKNLSKFLVIALNSSRKESNHLLLFQCLNRKSMQNPHAAGATNGTQLTGKRGMRTLEGFDELRTLRRSLLLSTMKKTLCRTLLNIGTTMQVIVGVIEEEVEINNNLGSIVGESLIAF